MKRQLVANAKFTLFTGLLVLFLLPILWLMYWSVTQHPLLNIIWLMIAWVLIKEWVFPFEKLSLEALKEITESAKEETV